MIRMMPIALQVLVRVWNDIYDRCESCVPCEVLCHLLAVTHIHEVSTCSQQHIHNILVAIVGCKV